MLGNTQVRYVPLVIMKPRQSPETSNWPHTGTKSGGGVSSVSSHASSIELNFAIPRSRWAGMLKSLALVSASFRSVTSGAGLTTGFAMSLLFAVVLLRCEETGEYVHFPCLCGLLKIDLTIKCFKPEESCFDVSGINASVINPQARTFFCICVEHVPAQD